MYVYFQKYSYQTKGSYAAYSFRAEDTENLTFIRQQDVEFEIPEDYDPTAQKLAALVAEKDKVNAEFAESIFRINERISKLQALEFTK